MDSSGIGMIRHLLRGTVALSLMTVSFAAMAQQGPPGQPGQPPATNIRGTITAFDGTVLSVHTRGGSDVTVTIPATANIAVATTFSLAEVKPGQKLAVVTLGQADGSTVALNIRPLPAQVPGSSSPYDLQPGSVMNNAAVDQVVSTDGGQQITLDTKSGPLLVQVVPQTSMTQTAAGTRDDLKVGEMVFAGARPDAAGTLVANRVEVGKNGVEPGE